MEYTKEQIQNAYEKIKDLLYIVKNLETTFEGRRFTLDGHLIGSIGEIMAAYYYGIQLYPPSTPVHDGIAPDGKKVQIKITQQNKIAMKEEPDYLIVLHLNRTNSEITEAYNGPGKKPWESAYKNNRNNDRYIPLNKLLHLNTFINPEEQIPPVNEIERFQKRK